MKALNLSAVICSLPVTIQKSENPSQNFQGILSPVFNSLFPRKKIYINSIENNDCSMGHKFKNNSFNGLYKDLIDQDADFILFFAKHELLYEDFFYSSINILEEIIFFYFFHVKSNNLSILSNIKKISYDISSLVLIVYLINFFFLWMKKKVFYKVQKLLSNVFISFFLINYILGFLNVLLIEFDKTNYLLTLEDLSLSSYYNPIIISKDIEDLFENSKLISKKVIWNKFKKTTLHPSCSYDATFTGQLECLNFMKNNNLALITEDKEIPFFENVYCADNNKLINKNDNYVWVYGKPFLTYSNYFPINKKIKLYKRKIFDKHVSSLFNMGRFIKLNIDVAKNLKVLFISKNSECILTKKIELLNKSYFFTQLVFKNYESLFIIFFLSHLLLFSLFSAQFLFQIKFKKKTKK